MDATTHIQRYDTHVGIGCFNPSDVRMTHAIAGSCTALANTVVPIKINPQDELRIGLV